MGAANEAGAGAARGLLLLGVVGDEVTAEMVRRVAAQLGWPGVRVRIGGVAAAREQLEAGLAPDLLLVDVSDSDAPTAAMDALAEVCEARTRVIALGLQNDVGLYRALIHMGVSDYLVKPVSAEGLAEALRRSERRGGDGTAPVPTARTVAVVGTRGGVGATSVAASIAWGFAQDQRLRTVLLDLDLQFGAAALTLDREPGRGLRELLAHPERIDGLLIGSAFAHHSERLRILGAEEALDAEIPLDGGALSPLLAALGDHAEAVVMEAPRAAPLGRTALAQADVAVVVADLSLPSLRDAQRLLALRAGLNSEGKTLLVGARLGGVPGEAPRGDFEKAVGRKLDFAVPFDAKAATAAAAEGKPLLAAAPQSPAGLELARLVARIAGAEPEAAAKASWISRLIGK